MEILGTLEFDETWSTTPFLHLLTRKNKFLPKVEFWTDLIV
jgi:hypothetical protein